MEQITIQENATRKWKRLNEIQNELGKHYAARKILESYKENPELLRFTIESNRRSDYSKLILDAANEIPGVKTVMVATVETILTETNREIKKLEKEFTDLLN